eukprot:178106-Chlamydomonas_euryale.AAC.5
MPRLAERLSTFSSACRGLILATSLAGALVSTLVMVRPPMPATPYLHRVQHMAGLHASYRPDSWNSTLLLCPGWGFHPRAFSARGRLDMDAYDRAAIAAPM